MAREDQSPEQPAIEAPEFEQSITEFCTQRSRTDGRVELIGAFFKVETAAGRVKDMPSAFAARLEQFASAEA